MENKETALYAAFKTKDPRFDGHFFVGVRSTGIYCRPICRAKLPKPENCTYFSTAAEAEQEGFRPCLLCRPELAPGSAPVDATVSLAHRAARVLEENCGSIENLEDLAFSMGCSDRHLRRVFSAVYHVSPIQYLQTCRLLLAKNLLTDTRLSVLDVAMTSGFHSLRRFNDVFKNQYQLTPTALRKQSGNGEEIQGQDNITLTLGYRPPYGWKQLLSFLALRTIPGVEVVKNDAYFRTVRLTVRQKKTFYGWIRIENRPRKNVLQVTVSVSLLPVVPQVLSRIRHLFDLYCDPDVIYKKSLRYECAAAKFMRMRYTADRLFRPFRNGRLRCTRPANFSKAASTLAGRLAQTFGLAIETGIEELTHAFPTPQDLLALDCPIEDTLGPLGISASKSKTILTLAKALKEGELSFHFNSEPHMVTAKLLDISGIGPWTAQYLSMRCLGWTDAFPYTDYGIKKALAPRTEQEILELADKWRPWRSYAAINIWNSL